MNDKNDWWGKEKNEYEQERMNSEVLKIDDWQDMIGEEWKRSVYEFRVLNNFLSLNIIKNDCFGQLYYSIVHCEQYKFANF